MKERIAEALAGLKDFQRKTVDYVFDQLYRNDRSKMLIADEVGLGKTIVAKGILAKAFDLKQSTAAKVTKAKPFNAVYICSNMALASQNIKKLNFLKDDIYVNQTINRLIYLAYKPAAKPQPFQIYALTPGISFDPKSHQGEINERAIIFCLLAVYAPFFNRWNGLKWLLKGGVRNIDTWNNKIYEFWPNRYESIRNDLSATFRKQLLSYQVTSQSMPRLHAHLRRNREVSLWHALMEVCSELNHHNRDRFHFYGEIVGTLRNILSKLCLTYLEADVFILDEFQRYSNLIKLDEQATSPAIEIARAVFSLPDAKVLMLSATPFKPFTSDFDEQNGEVHYNEFITVLKFLMTDKADSFWAAYEQDRKALFGFLRHPDTIAGLHEEAIATKNRLEALYRTGMVRTEKLLASNDRDAMIRYIHTPVSIQPEDIHDFVALDQITVLLNEKYKTSLPVPLEHVKSCPFALSFLDNYQHKEKIRSIVSEDPELDKLLKQTKHGWVNLKTIRDYKPLIPSKGKTLPNAKLRLLLDETVHNNGWKYLWIPPSLPYYELAGAFKDSWGYSKTLLFSSWKLVPRMVASLVSYEAERLSIGNPASVSEREKREKPQALPYYFQKRRSPRPQFTFKVLKEEQEPQQMNNFILSYPCLFLAHLYDPAVNVSEKKSIAQIKKELKNRLVTLFKRRNLNQYVSGEGNWQKWYWLAPLLLDRTGEHSLITGDWMANGIPPSELSMDVESNITDKEEHSGRARHFDHAWMAYQHSGLIAAGKLDDEQLQVVCEHLAELTIGSPAICFLRSQTRYKELSADILSAAFNMSAAFLSMLNKPESIAVVRIHTKDNNYWKQALQYMIDGNIQAMLDEFIYLLHNGENIQKTTDLSDYISDILSVRTTTSDIEDYPTFIDNLTRDKPTRKAIRSHYAADFGIQKVQTAHGTGRQINLRQAFNSPFRPFVLASTSIGQEGLDFHLYCKKIFHWNLPSNPIDFEQREGRIHRYQGLVIRLNLAKKYCDEIKLDNESNNVLRALFTIASKEKSQARFPCDLVPFWHTEPHNDIKIERFVPLYPFSKDIDKFNNLIKILTFYRLTFGQPRQQELIDALHDAGFSNAIIGQLDELIINLSPIKFS